ncbi:hypothetical protein NL676_007278 [Syzygium grande]|nr:hypothetical protein NL676_007278 [Syzygium grande]
MEDRNRKLSSEDIETWQQALKNVGGISGKESKTYSGDWALIQAVVHEVVVRLETRRRPVTEDLVGMEDQIAAINKLLDIGPGAVRLIAIYGMGGIGKTTLANIIFNQLYSQFGKNCCFLEGVRETALQKLQEKLLSDISYSGVAGEIQSIHDEIKRIGDTICNKKMLIVLDDVDKGNQIQNLIPVNSLYPGTTILVTTRDTSVLNIRGFENKFKDYEMVGLSKEDALNLFNIIRKLRLKSTEIKEGVQVQALRLQLWIDSDLINRGCITITSEEIKRGKFPDQYGCNQRLEATILSQLQNAVVVNLSALQFTDDAFKSLIKRARKLKVLTIEHNDSIHGTPTFPENSVLEKLTICDNSYFWKIDRSIGNLRCLTNLSVESCPKLRKLPEQIGELRSLQHLSLRSCFRLIELPDSVSKLELLMKLDVSYTGIKRLPDSIGRLPSLSFVVASGTLIEKLPSTMSEFRQLQTLDLIGCDGIQELPKLPISLTTLLLRSTSLLTVPNLSDLTNLVELVLSDRSDSMAGSDIIQTCDLRWIGKLDKLSKLRFCFPNVHAPTIELGSLSQLEGLTLYGLDLPTLEQLPSNLIVLELYDTRGKQVHYNGLPQLEKETVSSTSRKSREKTRCTSNMMFNYSMS